MAAAGAQETWNALIAWARERCAGLAAFDDDHFDADYELLRLLDNVRGPAEPAVSGEQLAFDFPLTGAGAEPSTSVTVLAAITLRRTPVMDPAA